MEFPEILYRRMKFCHVGLPASHHIEDFTDGMIRFMFPVRCGRNMTVNCLRDEWERLQRLFADLLSSLHHLPDDASPEDLSRRFFVNDYFIKGEKLPILFQYFV